MKTKIALGHSGPQKQNTDPTIHWPKLAKEHFISSLSKFTKFIDFSLYSTNYYAYIYEYSFVDDKVIFFNVTCYTNDKNVTTVTKHGSKFRVTNRIMRTLLTDIAKDAIMIVHDKQLEPSVAVYKPNNLDVYSIYSFNAPQQAKCFEDVFKQNNIDLILNWQKRD